MGTDMATARAVPAMDMAMVSISGPIHCFHLEKSSGHISLMMVPMAGSPSARRLPFSISVTQRLMKISTRTAAILAVVTRRRRRSSDRSWLTLSGVWEIASGSIMAAVLLGRKPGGRPAGLHISAGPRSSASRWTGYRG